mmetsp:Transcript_7929/g.12141  ORF Transcript_7929/g.12141 Transcript_7929/m.12141 type:complete len:280 (+) Transcript_7929:195-1034(+)
MVGLRSYSFSRLCVSILLILVPRSSSEPVLPVHNLQASLTASVAHGTTVAIKVQDAVVIINRSPKPNSKFPALQPKTSALPFTKHGLKLLPFKSKPQWGMLAPNLFCTMTGFSADISHLMMVLSRTNEKHNVDFHQPLPLHKSVLSLSSILKDATKQQGARPFGVEALIIGLDRDNEWQLYSCNPSGLYQHFPRGRSIIGKNKEKIWKEISKKDDIVDIDPIGGLKLCLSAILASLESTAQSQYDDDIFEGLLLWKADSGCCVSRIHPELLKEIIFSCQ